MLASQEQNSSEVARLLGQINAEYEAARQGMTGLAQGVGQHRFITKRMERIAELHAQLRNLVGYEAMALITRELDDQEEEGDLTAIASQLKETAAYAVRPTFKEELRPEVLQQFQESYASTAS